MDGFVKHWREDPDEDEEDNVSVLGQYWNAPEQTTRTEIVLSSTISIVLMPYRRPRQLGPYNSLNAMSSDIKRRTAESDCSNSQFGKRRLAKLEAI